MTLVVDDDEPIRNLVSLVLAEDGLGVMTAGDGAEALERVRQQVPAAIVLDLMMPVMDGWTFVARCRELFGDIPIVVTSAPHALSERAQDLRSNGVRAVVAKPFDIGALLALIRHYAGALPDRGERA